MTKKEEKSPPRISTKDQKILWGKAAQRCSICQIELTFDTVTSKDTLGEMCHIVGEKDTDSSPRGKSNLSLEYRNTYSNMILLCRNHHIVIDQDVDKFSVPYLHKIKADHENWIAEQLGPNETTPADNITVNLIDSLTSKLFLFNWNIFVEHAVTQIVHSRYIETMDDISAIKLSTLWDKLDEEVSIIIKELIDSYIIYIQQYLEKASLRGSSQIFRANKEYRKFSKNPKEWKIGAELENLWARKNFFLLCKFTYHLNEFSHMVRKLYNPYYFAVRGKFLIIDSFGTFNGGEPVYIEPKKMTFEKNLIEIEKEIIENNIE